MTIHSENCPGCRDLEHHEGASSFRHTTATAEKIASWFWGLVAFAVLVMIIVFLVNR